MGRFESVLLCSDVDGTIAWGKEIPARNIEAVSRFMREGGRFTLTSGRTPFYLMALGIPFNSPLVAYNGSEIYDADARRILWSAPMRAAGIYEPLTALLRYADDLLSVYCFFAEDEDSCRIEDVSKFDPAEFEGKTLLKIVASFKPDRADAADRWNGEARQSFPQFRFMHSWQTGIEQLAPDAGKDVCVRWLKDTLGIQTLVCVGDQENDLAMLRAADLAFCPENATDEVKAVCLPPLCSVYDGCIADLIDRLPALLDEREKKI